MNMKNTTTMISTAQVERQWIVIDVSGKILGTMATEIATHLIGKHKKDYTPHIEAGDYVVVINAAQVAVTGNKENDKLYYHHTGQPGGLRKRSLGELRETNPEKIITQAVRNMLPKNKLRAVRLRRLKVFAGSEHPHMSHFSK